MMRRPILIICILVSAAVFSSAQNQWDGSAIVGDKDEFPSDGLYAASDTFPERSVVELTNPRSGETVRVTVTHGIDGSGLFMALSDEAAEALGIESRFPVQIRARQISVPDITSMGAREDFPYNPDPDINPSAGVAEPSEETIDPTGSAVGAVTRPEAVTPPEESRPPVEVTPPEATTPSDETTSSEETAPEITPAEEITPAPEVPLRPGEAVVTTPPTEQPVIDEPTVPPEITTPFEELAPDLSIARPAPTEVPDAAAAGLPADGPSLPRLPPVAVEEGSEATPGPQPGAVAQPGRPTRPTTESDEPDRPVETPEPVDVEPTEATAPEVAEPVETPSESARGPDPVPENPVEDALSALAARPGGLSLFREPRAGTNFELVEVPTPPEVAGVSEAPSDLPELPRIAEDDTQVEPPEGTVEPESPAAAYLPRQAQPADASEFGLPVAEVGEDARPNVADVPRLDRPESADLSMLPEDLDLAVIPQPDTPDYSDLRIAADVPSDEGTTPVDGGLPIAIPDNQERPALSDLAANDAPDVAAGLDSNLPTASVMPEDVPSLPAVGREVPPTDELPDEDEDLPVAAVEPEARPDPSEIVRETPPSEEVSEPEEIAVAELEEEGLPALEDLAAAEPDPTTDFPTDLPLAFVEADSRPVPDGLAGSEPSAPRDSERVFPLALAEVEDQATPESDDLVVVEPEEDDPVDPELAGPTTPTPEMDALVERVEGPEDEPVEVATSEIHEPSPEGEARVVGDSIEAANPADAEAMAFEPADFRSPEVEDPDTESALAAAEPAIEEDDGEIEVAIIEPGLPDGEDDETLIADSLDGPDRPVEDAEISAEPAEPAGPEDPESSIRITITPAEDRTPEPLATGVAEPALPSEEEQADDREIADGEPDDGTEIVVVPVDDRDPADAEESPNVWAERNLPLVKDLQEDFYYLQVGAFANPRNAKNILDSLAPGYPTAVYPLEREASDTIYRVFVGPLNEDEQGIVLYQFRTQGFDNVIMRQGGID